MLDSWEKSTASTSLPPAAQSREATGIAKTAKIALFLLTALNLINFIDRYVLAGVQPLVQKEFGVSDERIGALTSAFFLTYMLAAPAMGWLGDHFPRKPLIVIGALLWSAATLMTAWVHSYETLYFRHAIVGIGEATFSIFAPALLADFYPEADRNRVLSIFYVAIPLGAALGYVTGAVLGQMYGWRAPFFVAAIPGVLIAVLFAWLVREPQRGSADRLAPTVNRTTILGLAANPAFLTGTFGMAMTVFAMGGISAFLPTFLNRFAGYSVAQAGILVGGVTAVDGILGTWLGGWLAQRWLRTDHRALYLLSACSAGLTVPFGAIAFFGPRPLMIPAIVLAEFFLFLGTGPLNAAIVNSVGASVRATAISINLLIIHALGDFPSPRVIGRISDHSSLRIGMGATLVTLMMAAIILWSGGRFAPMIESQDRKADPQAPEVDS